MTVELEQIFLRLHSRVSRSAAAVFDASSRRFIEWLMLLASILLFSMFLALHVQFVGRIDPQSCMIQQVSRALSSEGGPRSVDLLRVSVSTSWTPMLDGLRSSLTAETLRLWCDYDRGHGAGGDYASCAAQRELPTTGTPPVAVIAATARYLALQTELMRISTGVEVNASVATRELLLQAMASLHSLLTGEAEEEQDASVEDPSAARASVMLRAARRTLASISGMRGEAIISDAAAFYKSLLRMMVSRRHEKDMLVRHNARVVPPPVAPAAEPGETTLAPGISTARMGGSSATALGADAASPSIFWRLEESVSKSLAVLLRDDELLDVVADVYVANLNLTRAAMGGAPPMHPLRAAVTALWPNALINNSFIEAAEASMTTVAGFLWRPNKIGDEPHFLYSTDKGLLSTSAAKRDALRVRLLSVRIDAKSECVGPHLHRWLLHEFAGYDTAVLNALIAAVGGTGFVMSQSAGEIRALSHALEVERFAAGIQSLLLFKVGTLCSAVFLLFSASSLVSFILAQTQQRMLRFTISLQHNVRARLPLLPLVVSHLLDSLIFVPIMLGVLFFLFEFFSDQLLAFLVLLVVWLCELWSIVSCRTLGSLRVFPRVFGLLMTWFHVYYLTYPFGYQYLALASTSMSLLACIFFLWNRYELPALLSGDVSARTPRVAVVADIMSMSGNSTVFGTLLLGREGAGDVESPRSPVPLRGDFLRPLMRPDHAVARTAEAYAAWETLRLRNLSESAGLSDLAARSAQEAAADDDTGRLTRIAHALGAPIVSRPPADRNEDADEAGDDDMPLQSHRALRAPPSMDADVDAAHAAEPVTPRGWSEASSRPTRSSVHDILPSLMRTPPRGAHAALSGPGAARPSRGRVDTSASHVTSTPPREVPLPAAVAAAAPAVPPPDTIAGLFSNLVMSRPRGPDGAPVASAASDADDDMMAGWTGHARGR